MVEASSPLCYKLSMTRISAFILCAYLVLTGLLGCVSEDKKLQAELHLQIGTGHLMKAHYPDAIRELRVAESLEPDNPITHNNLAIALYARKQFASSEEHLRKALDLKSDYTEARNNLGRLLIDTKRYDEAIQELKLVTQDLTYSQPERAYDNLALAYLQTRNFKLAKKNAQAAINLNRADCVAKGLMGQILFQQKQYVAAAAHLDSAIELCKNLDEAHYFGALSYLQIGQKEKARARMKELISLYPESHFSDLARAELLKLE